jgi:hypothetical protein
MDALPDHDFIFEVPRPPSNEFAATFFQAEVSRMIKRP